MDPAEERAGIAARVPPGTESWPAGGARAGAGASVARLPEAGDLLGGRFFLRRLLGAGATGVVFEALDHVSGQSVALKVLRHDAVLGTGFDRLRREVRLSRPGHPNVVRLNDLHEADGHLLLSMELVEGRSLSARFSEERPFSIVETVEIGMQVAGALAYLHGNGLVHRDVKPGNVLLADEGPVKLCDLGLLRPVDHGLTVTMTEAVVGTPAYMAPEQAAGKELTGATDVYALGLTLWQALTGTIPMSGSTAVETFTRRQRGTPPRLRPVRPDCPRWLEALLRRMLAPRPEDRPAAASVEKALSAGRFRPFPRPRTLAAALFALVALGALAAGVNALLTRRTVRFESEGSVVRGVDSHGRATFTFALESPVQQLLEADLDGDGEREAVVVSFTLLDPTGRREGTGPAELAVLDVKGRLRTRLRPEESVREWTHPFSRSFRLAAQATDLDGDGAQELVVNAAHRTFYPTALFVYWPKAGAWEYVLDHWGHIYALVGLPGRAPRLRFLAVNNALGFANVLGEIEIPPPARRGASVLLGPRLATIPGLTAKDSAARWVAYSLLTVPRGRLGPEGLALEVLPDGGTLVRTGAVEITLDRRGNPRAGPNVGQELGDLRLEFVTGAVIVNPGTQWNVGPEPVLRLRERLRERVRPLLDEPPYRLAFDVEFARQLAAAGAPAEAASVLRRTARDVPSEEVDYQLAGFLALAGDLAESAAILRRCISEGEGVRVGFDAPSLLLRVAAERRDAADAATAVGFLANDDDRQRAQPGLGATLRARANLLMDRLEAADGEVRSWPWAADGDALAVLARWRLGRSLPADVGTMKAFLTVAGDGEKDGELALAAALLAAGRPDEAARRCRDLSKRLEWDARRSLERRQQLLLARGLHARALLATGDVDAARAKAHEVLSEARPGLLWTNLANEVLGAVGRDAAARR